MMLNFLMMVYAVVVSFALTSANRNVREARPHGRAIEVAGPVAMSASATLAVLLLGWAALYQFGYAPEPILP